jgi:hypothetical protein
MIVASVFLPIAWPTMAPLPPPMITLFKPLSLASADWNNDTLNTRIAAAMLTFFMTSSCCVLFVWNNLPFSLF